MNTILDTTTNSSTQTSSTKPAASFARRFAKSAAATALVGALGLGVAGTAQALPIRPPIDTGGGGIIILPPGDAAIFGTVDLNGCVTDPANVQVMASITGQSVRASITSNGNGTYGYYASGLYNSNYALRASLLNGACPFGSWTTQTASFTASSGWMLEGPRLQYRMPTKVTRVPGFLIAGAARLKAGDLAIKLDNLGPQHGASRHLANNSTVSVAGVSRTFTLPEVTVDIDPCGWCPDFGDGRFYVRDTRSNGVSFNWDRGLTMGVTFESSDREIKGYYTPYSTSSSIDSLMPDIEMSNARLNVTMVPVLNGSGGIKLVPSGSAFSATTQATGGCSVEAVDVCNWISGYKTQIRDAASAGANAALSSGTVQSLVSAEIRKVLNQQGIGTVRGVFLDGDDVVIAE